LKGLNNTDHDFKKPGVDFKVRSSMFTWTWIIPCWWVSYSTRDLLFQPIATLIRHLSGQRSRRKWIARFLDWSYNSTGHIQRESWISWVNKAVLLIRQILLSLWKITANSLDLCCLVFVIKGWYKYSLFGSESKIKRMLSLSYTHTCTVFLLTKA